jgi:hypothetical protein
MTPATAIPGDPSFPRLRRGLLWLAALTSAGIAVELAVERHWTQPGQLIAWGALAALLVAIALLGRRPSARSVRIARVAAGLVMIASVVGVWQHVAANYDAGPLDFRYTNVWDSLPELSRWWLAVSKTVGAAPPLAPGALAQAALAVLLATVGQPVTREVGGPDQRAQWRAAARSPGQPLRQPASVSRR